MADVFSKEKRSEVMSKIRGKNTKYEVLVAKWLHSKGFRYRKNDSRYPGKPDIVLPKYKTVVFIHGCFWHGHDNCKLFKIPKSRTEFWTQKIECNKERDRKNEKLLRDDGWNVIILWECNLRKDLDGVLHNLESQILSYGIR